MLQYPSKLHLATKKNWKVSSYFMDLTFSVETDASLPENKGSEYSLGIKGVLQRTGEHVWQEKRRYHCDDLKVDTYLWVEMLQVLSDTN
jgi:hypothetical protein